MKIISNKRMKEIKEDFNYMGEEYMRAHNEREKLIKENNDLREDLMEVRENYGNFAKIISEFLEKQEKIIRQEMIKNFGEQNEDWI